MFSLFITILNAVAANSEPQGLLSNIHALTARHPNVFHCSHNHSSESNKAGRCKKAPELVWVASSLFDFIGPSGITFRGINSTATSKTLKYRGQIIK